MWNIIKTDNKPMLNIIILTSKTIIFHMEFNQYSCGL